MIGRAARAAFELAARVVEHVLPLQLDFDFGLTEQELMRDLSRCSRPEKTYLFDPRDGGAWH